MPHGRGVTEPLFGEPSSIPCCQTPGCKDSVLVRLNEPFVPVTTVDSRKVSIKQSHFYLLPINKAFFFSTRGVGEFVDLIFNDLGKVDV